VLVANETAILFAAGARSTPRRARILFDPPSTLRIHRTRSRGDGGRKLEVDNRTSAAARAPIVAQEDSMKALLSALVLAAVCAAPGTGFAADKNDVTITSRSPDAVAAFKRGRDFSDMQRSAEAVV
jgi:hypothetical protein